MRTLTALRRTLPLFLVFLAPAALAKDAGPAKPAELPAEAPTLQPAEVAKLAAAKENRPLFLHVGFKKLYQQAHIPNSEYFGPATEAEVVERLKARLAKVPKTAPIILYCGCCPWERCPNIKAAWRVLRELGFTNAKAMYVAKDFGADWADKGYPVASGD